MKESMRRVILFTVIVITGSVMILLDVPLLILIPLILATGFVVLLLLGAITFSEIKSVFRRPEFQNLKKISFLKRLDDMKFFEKKTVQPEKQQAAPQKSKIRVSGAAKKTGPVSHLRSFVSSLRSLGTVISERSRYKKKVEHIDELLDKTVSEKVRSSTRNGAGKGGSTGSSFGSPGQTPQDKAQDLDPFVSLSGDEFDISLLDGLDDSEPPLLSSSPGQGPSPSGTGGPDVAIPEPDISLPTMDISSDADGMFHNSEKGLEEFNGLEGGESLDQDFKDLEDLDLDNIDLDTGLDSGLEEAAPDVSPPPVAGGVSPPEHAAQPVKTDWVASDAPRDAGTAVEDTTRSDMASFARGASGSDEDMLSSLASDVRHVKKEKNLSLLRELNDYKAPATDIEDELKVTYDMLKLSKTEKNKAGIPPVKGIK